MVPGDDHQMSAVGVGVLGGQVSRGRRVGYIGSYV